MAFNHCVAVFHIKVPKRFNEARSRSKNIARLHQPQWISNHHLIMRLWIQKLKRSRRRRRGLRRREGGGRGRVCTFCVGDQIIGGFHRHRVGETNSHLNDMCISKSYAPSFTPWLTSVPPSIPVRWLST